MRNEIFLVVVAMENSAVLCNLELTKKSHLRDMSGCAHGVDWRSALICMSIL